MSHHLHATHKAPAAGGAVAGSGPASFIGGGVYGPVNPAPSRISH